MAIIFVRTFIIYIFVIFAIRFMGKRQLGELAPHELVITILISSVATIPLQSNETPLSTSIIPILMLIAFEIIESVFSMKSLKFRYFLQGRPMFIIKDGILQQSAFKKLRLSIDDVICALRQQGIFNIEEVQNAVIETNGGLSIQKKSQYDPLTPSVLNITQPKTSMPITIIMDGKVINEYFKDKIVSNDKIKLLVKSSDKQTCEIMYMSIDEYGDTIIIEKDEKS